MGYSPRGCKESDATGHLSAVGHSAEPEGLVFAFLPPASKQGLPLAPCCSPGGACFLDFFPLIAPPELKANCQGHDLHTPPTWSFLQTSGCSLSAPLTLN